MEEDQSERVDELLDYLSDEGEYLRQRAAEALGLLGIKEERIIIPLRHLAAKDYSASVRQAAGKALRALGHEPPPPVPPSLRVQPTPQIQPRPIRRVHPIPPSTPQPESIFDKYIRISSRVSRFVRIGLLIDVLIIGCLLTLDLMSYTGHCSLFGGATHSGNYFASQCSFLEYVGSLVLGIVIIFRYSWWALLLPPLLGWILGWSLGESDFFH